MTACMHIWTNIAGSAAVEESSMLATGAVLGRRLQNPGCGRRRTRDLIMEEVHGIPNSIPFEADISRGSLHHQSSGYITMEWKRWQHAREAVESTASSATSTTQAKSSLLTGRMKKKMEHLILIPDWSRRVDDQSIHKRAQFSNPPQELREAVTVTTTSSKYLPKCLSSRLQLN